MQYFSNEIEEATIELLTLVLQTHAIVIERLLISLCKIVPYMLTILYLQPLIPALTIVPTDEGHDDEDKRAKDKKRDLPIP
jgi:hypothetical protein